MDRILETTEYYYIGWLVLLVGTYKIGHYYGVLSLKKQILSRGSWIEITSNIVAINSGGQKIEILKTGTQAIVGAKFGRYGERFSIIISVDYEHLYDRNWYFVQDYHKIRIIPQNGYDETYDRTLRKLEKNEKEQKAFRKSIGLWF